MLSRSGLSIRRLMPQRRFSDEDVGGIDMKEENALLISWMDQDGGNMHVANKRPNRKKRSTAPIIATSPLTHYDILRPLPPLPSETPRSSASSPCRCERHAECDCPLVNLRRRSPLCSISSKDGSEDSIPLSSTTSYGAEESPNRRVPKSKFCLSIDTKSNEDLTLPLSSSENNKDKSSRDQALDQAPPEVLSEDVQQFMQEADEAFKAIGRAISEVRLVKSTMPQSTKPDFSDTSPTLESTPPTPPPKETPAPPSKSFPGELSSEITVAPKTPPKDNALTLKVKKKKSKTSKQSKFMKPQQKSTAPKLAVKSGPRWTLTENVSELLTGKLFHRIEADEMLTPDQIEAYKQQRMSRLQKQRLTEAVENDSADTPIEPFHLEDLPLRIGSAGVKTNLETQSEEKSAISFSEDVVARNFSFERQYADATSSLPTEKPLEQRSVFHKNSSPMSSSRHSRSASRRQITGLPSIPETSTTARPAELSMDNSSNDSLDDVHDSEYVFLKSSPCSITTPTFRHGPIRLSKSDLVPDVKLGADDGLDWTAFQMAILGGAGDWFSDTDDTLRQREAEDIADIAEWWDSWHFESNGDLLNRDCEASSPTSTISGEELPDISYSEIESDNPYSPHHRWQEVRRKAGVEGLQLDIDFVKGKRIPSHYLPDARDLTEKWKRDSEQKQVVDHESVTSLPPSPMLDLRVINSGHGDDLDVVPMGYNLGHDLGDFLKWEAEHAYAGDFSSPSAMM
ncbi:hypothetical protein F5Y19DRAFT_342035 [Xylariaceae sp. FL1651]|nr:hypothetical protein F5Y19DRAFT_342035 [Xylariaceae sp. FL1651]